MRITAVTPLALDGVVAIAFARIRDQRGYFCESFRDSDLLEHPQLPQLRARRFVLAYEIFSRAGVFRGLHVQWKPHMGKLLRVVRGRMIDYQLDVRLHSPTFGMVAAHPMAAAPTDSGGEWIYVPPGYAHGCHLLDESLVEYFLTGYYNPDCEAAISLVAADIDWSLVDAAYRPDPGVRPVTSARDADAMDLATWAASAGAAHFRFEDLDYRSCRDGRRQR